MKLYEIRQEIENLMNLIDEDGTIEESSFAQLEELAIAEEDKLENIGLLLKNWTAEAKAIRKEEKALADRRRAIENQAERLKEYAGNYMLKSNRSEFKTAKVRLSFRKSTAVQVDSDELVPDEFWQVKKEISRSLIGKALEDGQVVAGCMLVERQNLQVK
jgi:hypothetical protein